MRKIFQLITSVNLGGAENVAFNIAEHCEKEYSNDFEFVIVALFSTRSKYAKEKRTELISKNIRIINLSTLPKRISLLIAPFYLFYQIIKEKPQIIHSHTDLPDFVLSSAIRLMKFFKLKTPKIVRTIHNTELWYTHNRLGKYTETAFKDDVIVGVSEAALSAYNNIRFKNKLITSTSQQIIYNGCTIPNNIINPFRINKEKINIAFCGRFEFQKGIDVLIKRIPEINSVLGDKFLFHVIGSGEFENEVVKLSKISENVYVYKPIPNIAEKLNDFDFIIMPSRFEGLVLISIEASFSKVPIIAAFAPGLNETLPPDWPLQFHLENSIELLTIFEKIVKKEYDLDKLKHEAYKYVSENFSLSKMIDSYAKLYIECND